jgi:hypothetical protein
MKRIIAGVTVHAYEMMRLHDCSGTSPASCAIEIEFRKSTRGRRNYWTSSQTPVGALSKRNQMMAEYGRLITRDERIYAVMAK